MENEEFERLFDLVMRNLLVGVFILITLLVVGPFLKEIININYVLLPILGFYSILSVIGLFIILAFFVSKITNRIKVRHNNGQRR